MIVNTICFRMTGVIGGTMVVIGADAVEVTEFECKACTFKTGVLTYIAEHGMTRGGPHGSHYLTQNKKVIHVSMECTRSDQCRYGANMSLLAM